MMPNKRNWRLSILGHAIGVALLVLPGPLAAQDWSGRGRAQGIVTDLDGKPLEGATVKLSLPDDPDLGPEALTTDKKGRWSYLGLRNGVWNVYIEYPGLVPSEGVVQVNEFGTARTITIALRPIPPEELAEQAATEAMKRLDEGNTLLAAGNYAEARTAYEAALEDLEPEYRPAILVGIAQTHYKEGAPEKSIETIERALELDPANVAALKLISNLLIAEGREADAQAYMARLPADEKLDANAYLNVGIDHYNNGDMEAALAQFEKVVAGYPENPEGYYYRGLIFLNLNRNEEAAADLKKNLKLDPGGSHAAEVKEFLKFIGGDG